MMRSLMMCLVLCVGCVDDGDAGGVGTSPTSTPTAGRVWTASGVTGRGELSAQGVPRVGNQPRADWCGAAESCTGADLAALYGGDEAVVDACGCVTSLRLCPGHAFDFASAEDPLHARCEELAAAYPVP